MFISFLKLEMRTESYNIETNNFETFPDTVKRSGYPLQENFKCKIYLGTLLTEPLDCGCTLLQDAGPTQAHDSGRKTTGPGPGLNILIFRERFL